MRYFCATKAKRNTGAVSSSEAAPACCRSGSVWPSWVAMKTGTVAALTKAGRVLSVAGGGDTVGSRDLVRCRLLSEVLGALVGEGIEGREAPHVLANFQQFDFHASRSPCSVMSRQVWEFAGAL